ncbi:uncharacterized protein G2W53_006398 [Senna tora]|uniref:Uncharacterized protein n=1 Tax=Senna tora TaxID=362788 RepID=A0A835CDY3_9FABA|nr:uncharacterized protein G2W53_006398 [Senna tora]
MVPPFNIIYPLPLLYSFCANALITPLILTLSSINLYLKLNHEPTQKQQVPFYSITVARA